MERDNEINSLILEHFPNLEKDFILLKSQEENGVVDSYEFCINSFLPYILTTITNKNDEELKKLMTLLEKMVLSEDSYLVNYGMAVIVEDIINRNVDLDYFMSFANEKLNKKIQPVIDYFKEGKRRK